MPLSTKQMEYLALAWQCFDVEPKIDYVKFAQVAGLASAHSARELMRVTKNKLKNEYGALSGSVKTTNAKTTNGTSNKTPNKGSAKKNGLLTSTSATGSEAGTPTPTPSSQRGKKRAKSVSAEVGHGGDEEMDGRDESPVKKIKKEGKAKEVDSVMAEESDDAMWN